MFTQCFVPIHKSLAMNSQSLIIMGHRVFLCVDYFACIILLSTCCCVIHCSYYNISVKFSITVRRISLLHIVVIILCLILVIVKRKKW